MEAPSYLKLLYIVRIGFLSYHDDCGLLNINSLSKLGPMLLSISNIIFASDFIPCCSSGTHILVVMFVELPLLAHVLTRPALL